MGHKLVSVLRGRGGKEGYGVRWRGGGGGGGGGREEGSGERNYCCTTTIMKKGLVL